VNDSTIQSLPQGLLVELETLRDQRDLYRSLLLSELAPLAACMAHALETVERIRTTLRASTRDGDAFRGKIERLQDELSGLGETMLGLHLPSISARLTAAQSALHSIGMRAHISGDDLLPAMVALEELCSHLLIAADCAAVHLPPVAGNHAGDTSGATQQGAAPTFAATLQQLNDAFATEQGKRVALVTMGLEDIPEVWRHSLSEVLGELLRNSIEHGIESPAQRTQRAKPEMGTLVVEFIDRGAQGFDLTMQDDGGGLNAEHMAEVAVRLGLLSAQAAATLGAPKLASLLLQPGGSSARIPGQRGLGLQIVREQVHRMGGRLQVAAKRGQFTRYRISLPALAQAEFPARPDGLTA
jgi:signal transduction histidine kinase